MTAHISDELPRLLTGEATREVVQAAAAHLRACEDCQQELVSAVVAHASLTSAHRFAPEVVARPAPEPSGAAAAGEEATTLPDLSAVFAQVRADAEGGPRAPRRSRRPLYAVAAVAAGVLVGAGATALIQNTDHHTPAGQSVALAAFDTGTGSAKAIVDKDGRMRVDAASLPNLDAAHRYEVWLTNDARSQMQPIGWIGTNGKATLTVPANLMSNYSDIEVSVQRVDAPSYTYSGTSVLRGSYA
jgi:anti-sigma-K factor RskA